MDQCRESLREIIAEARNQPMFSPYSSQKKKSDNNSAKTKRLRGISDQDFDRKGINSNPGTGLASSIDISNSLQQAADVKKSLSIDQDSEEGYVINAHLSKSKASVRLMRLRQNTE